MKNTLIIILTAFTFQANSQDLGSIFTDRPSQTDAVALLPPKVFQVESGFYWSRDQIGGATSTSMDIPNLMLKYGLVKWLELRMGSSVKYQRQENVSILTTDTEAGPIFFAPKFKILEPRGIIPLISATAYFYLPGTGSGFAKVNDGALTTRLLFENALANNISLAYSIGTDSDFNGTTNGFYSVMVSASISRLSGFVEIFSSIIDNAQNPVGLDGGVGFLLSENFIVDLTFGVSLNTNAIDLFMNSGFGYRIH